MKKFLLSTNNGSSSTWENISSNTWGEYEGTTWFDISGSTTYYTIIDGQLIPLQQSSLTSELFIEHGFDNIPSSEILVQLTNPKVLYWQDNYDTLPELNATVTANPKPQSIISERIDFPSQSIKSIISVAVTCTGDFEMLLSFDEQQTWKIWNGSSWVESSTGMSKEIVEAITKLQWDSIAIDAPSMYIKVILRDGSQIVNKVHFDFDNSD